MPLVEPGRAHVHGSIESAHRDGLPVSQDRRRDCAPIGPERPHANGSRLRGSTISGMKIQPLVAEFLGTFYLCFAGIAAIVCATPAIGSGAGIIGIALAHGLALAVAVNAFGGIS